MKEVRNHQIKAYLTEKEYKKVIRSSSLAGLSISSFVKNVCTGVKIESREDSQVVRDLLKVNADLGRLGGLLKLGIVETGKGQDFRPLLKEIEKRQVELQRAIQRL